MKRLVFAFALALALASTASAQYPGPGYPPSSGSGGGTPAFPLLPASTVDCSAPSYSWSDAPTWGLCRTTGGTIQLGASGSNQAAYSFDLGSGFFQYFVNNSTGANHIIQTTSGGITRIQTFDNSPSLSGTIDLSAGVLDIDLNSPITTPTKTVTVDGIVTGPYFQIQAEDTSSGFNRSFLYLDGTPGNPVGVIQSDDTAESISTKVEANGENGSAELYASSGVPFGRVIASAFGSAQIFAQSASEVAGVAASAGTGVTISTVGSKPACSISVNGAMWRTPGGAGVADTFEVCRKDAADVYAWVSLF